MNKEERIQRINRVLKGYFSDSSNPRSILAKELMDLFVSKGIFNKNHRDGLPIRKLLRDLSEKNRISEIPYAYGVKKSTNTNWFFSDINYVNGDDTLLSGSSEITKQPSCAMTKKTKKWTC